MCTVLLPPGDNPIAVNKYINLHSIKSFTTLWINELTAWTTVTDKLIVPQMVKNSTHFTECEVSVPCTKAKYIRSIPSHPICSKHILKKLPTCLQVSLPRFTTIKLRADFCSFPCFQQTTLSSHSSAILQVGLLNKLRFLQLQNWKIVMS